MAKSNKQEENMKRQLMGKALLVSAKTQAKKQVKKQEKRQAKRLVKSQAK
jgi:hypothetical protein